MILWSSKRTPLINPYEITNFKRNLHELEEFLLFTILVAGKTAYIQANKLQDFLNKGNELSNDNSLKPFDTISFLYINNLLNDLIHQCKLGQYTKLKNAFTYLCHNQIDLFNCSVDDLEKIPGVGPKTSRFFLLHSRKIDVAVLDVHILKYLQTLDSTTPKTTPSNKLKYAKYEKLFLDQSRKLNKTPAELDLEIWKIYAKKDKNAN